MSCGFLSSHLWRCSPRHSSLRAWCPDFGGATLAPGAWHTIAESNETNNLQTLTATVY
ncbi:MAG TPA: hypothetical protein VGL99_01340 [Chloroflexota bacterium]